MKTQSNAMTWVLLLSIIITILSCNGYEKIILQDHNRKLIQQAEQLSADHYKTDNKTSDLRPTAQMKRRLIQESITESTARRHCKLQLIN